MEMGRPGNGGGNGKVRGLNDDAVTGRRRNGSLSSYLDMGRDADAGRAAPRTTLPGRAPGLGSLRRTYADGELDVFAAERYFKGAMDGNGGDRKDQGGGFATTATAAAVETAAAARPAEAAKAAVVITKPSSTRASTVSWTASSASSANSQTALFRGGSGHRRRSSPRDNKCCVQVGVLMRTCTGKRSVRVDGCATTTKEFVVPGCTPEPAAASSRIDWYRELRMQKAALGHAGDGGDSHGGLVAAAGLPPSLTTLGTAKVAAIGRKVTPTAREEKEIKAAELSALSCASSRGRSFTLVAPVRANNVSAASGRVGNNPGGGADKTGGGDDDDDAGSESSSDLFEIKSLMIDECPYEPSEASIQWSVVTADASERGDRVSARWVGGGGRVPVPVTAAGRLHRDHRPTGLLAGCASHRAVDVSSAATNAAAAQRRSEGFQKARNGG